MAGPIVGAAQAVVNALWSVGHGARSIMASTTPLNPHDGAGTGRRSKSFAAPSIGPTRFAIADAETLRTRARHADRNNSWAVSTIDALASNLVGTGIVPHSRAETERVRNAVRDLWQEHIEESDADGVTTFYGQQSLATISMIVSGEAFARIRYRRASDGLSVPIQLQLLEPDHVPAWMSRDLPNGNRIVSGIELDRMGRRVAYHMYRGHPLEDGTSSETIRVPAAEVLHIYKPRRIGQLRGTSWLTPTLVRLFDVADYDDAERVRKKVAALVAGFITSPEPDVPFTNSGEQATEAGAEDADTWDAALEPGTMQVLKPGEDVKFSDPADVGGNYDHFLKWQMRGAAVGSGATYEQVTGDLSGVNFSSIRAGRLEFQRRAKMVQEQFLIPQLCQPYWRAWFDQAVLSGALSAPGYASNPRKYRSVKWFPQGWEWVDPVKEITANKMAVRCGFKSRSQIVAESGRLAEDVDREIAEEQAREAKNGVVYDSNASATANSGAAQSTDSQAVEDSTMDEKLGAA